MPYKILQNVILETVAYQTGDVLELDFVANETVTSLVERGVVEKTSDKATVERDEVVTPGDETIDSEGFTPSQEGHPTDTEVQTTQETPLDQPTTNEDLTSSEPPQQQTPAPVTSPSPTPEQLEQDFDQTSSTPSNGVHLG